MSAKVNVISDRARRRKRRERRWAMVRGLIAFALTFIALLASAWMGGDLRYRGHDSASIQTIPAHTIHPEAPIAPPPTRLAAPRRALKAATANEPISLYPPGDQIEVLRPEELAAISQAHRAGPAP